MLSKSLIKKIEAFIDKGDEFLNNDDFDEAIKYFESAISLIPDPIHEHDISLPAITALGEAHFFSGNFPTALHIFKQAMKSPGGVENPLAHLRLGQAYFENNELDKAAQALTMAYALEGRDIFDNEDDKYLSFLATQIDL